MQILYNSNTDLLYLRMDEEKQKVNNKRLAEDIVLELGADEKIVGIEILDASKNLNLVAPSEAWERGRHVNHKAETFHWNPAGSQARPGEPDPHPEASLALWWGNPPGEA